MKRRICIIAAIILLFAAAFTVIHQEGYKSYRDLGLDYELNGVMYDAGKNGYEFIMVSQVEGNTVYYQKASFEMAGNYGHKIFVGVGEMQQTKVSPRTKYYEGAPWDLYYDKIAETMSPGACYEYDEFKEMKILERCSKEDVLMSNLPKYALIKNGIISICIDPVVFVI